MDWRIFKNNSKILSTFFQVDFSSSPKAVKRPWFGQTFCAAGKIKKNRPKKAFLGSFWKNLTKKSSFFGARFPSKLVNIGAFKNFLGSISKNGYLKIVQRGTLGVGRWSNPWGSVHPPLKVSIIKELNLN